MNSLDIPQQMRAYYLTFFFVLVSNYIYAQKWTPKDFALPLHNIVSSPDKIYVTSGYTSTRPLPHRVCGVSEIISPPLVAKGFTFNLRFKVNNELFTDLGEFWGKNSLYSSGTWYPDRIVRFGTYHRDDNNQQLISFGITSELIPLFGKSGFIMKVNIGNRSSKSLDFQIESLVNPGNLFLIPLEKWGFSVPSDTTEVVKVNDTQWESDKVRMNLYSSDSSLVSIPAGESKSFYWKIILSDKKANVPSLESFEKDIALTTQAWQQRLDKYLAAVPVLKSNISGLTDYYKRSLISGLVCIWEKPDFILNPYVATSGIDGGGMNTYLWDIGYVPNMISLLFGEHAELLAGQLATVKLDEFYSFTPNGKGIGVSYSYSTFAFMNLIVAIARHQGVNKDLYDEAKRLIIAQENLPKHKNLIDFGNQHNLLEMRNSGYEHFVVSPNAERAWSLRKLAEMADFQDYDKNYSKQWKIQADTIINSIRQQLWDDTLGWFICIYPNGRKEVVYSVQVFDAMRMGVCTPAMKKKLYQHLAEGKFLFQYGISSVSAEDSLHYEYNDTDWGGSGAYTGDGPQLAQVLYDQEESERGWDILKRHFWMGKHLAYYPQEHYAEKPQHPAHKRANVIAGLAGAETILYYILGMKPQLDETLIIHPQPPSEGELFFNDLKWGDRRIDLSISGKQLKIWVDKKLTYSGKNTPIKISKK